MSQPDSKLADGEEDAFESLEENLEASLEEAPFESGEEGEEDDSPKKKKQPKRAVVLTKPKANVYTMMLFISLVALIIGCLCLWGEMEQYGMKVHPPR